MHEIKENMIEINRILDRLGFSALSPMQNRMVAEAGRLSGVVLLSPTGTGKSLAYMLPLAEQIDLEEPLVQAVVIVPTRELAAQSEAMFREMRTGIRVVSLYGGRPAMQEHRTIREVQPQVVFATPGRMNDHLQKGNVGTGSVRLLVIDEFDKCLELGFQSEMETLVGAMSKLGKCWMTSATVSEAIPAFMSRLVKGYTTFDFLPRQPQTAARMKVWEVRSPQKDKLETLGQLLSALDGCPAIVFVAHRESVERVGRWLVETGFDAVMYHGGMEQDMRERALCRFRSGAANVLVSTDLAARGLDIPEVRAVVHYHLSGKADEYVHRNGRTARWDGRGDIYILCGPEENVPDYVEECSAFSLPEGRIVPCLPQYSSIYIGRGKKDKLGKGDILGFLCKKGGLTAGDIGRIDVFDHHAYVSVCRKKLKAVLSMTGGEKIKGMKTLIEPTRKY